LLYRPLRKELVDFGSLYLSYKQIHHFPGWLALKNHLRAEEKKICPRLQQYSFSCVLGKAFVFSTAA